MNLDYSTSSTMEVQQKTFVTKVYGWMTLALVITGFVAMLTYNSPTLLATIVENRWVFYGLLIGELLLVGRLSRSVGKMALSEAIFAFISYAVINGLTLSIIFLAYTGSSIASTFFITAGTFGIMSLYGYMTKKDLTSVGNIALMTLIGLIIASVINLFLRNDIIYWITTYIGIIIFVALTAYDTQKIKHMSMLGFDGIEGAKKGAIMGALVLYLDFINLFLLLLRILGRKK